MLKAKMPRVNAARRAAAGAAAPASPATPGFACRLCDRQFKQLGYLRMHLASHQPLITTEQLKYLELTGAAYADELAAIAADDSLRETEADDEADADDDADAPADGASGSSEHECAVCRKSYKLYGAYQTHLRRTGHGEIQVPQGGAGVDAPAAAGAADPAGDPMIADQVKLLAAAMGQIALRSPILAGFGTRVQDATMSGPRYQTPVHRLAAAQRAQGISPHENIRRKYTDYAIYHMMVEVRLQRQMRHKSVLRKLVTDEEIGERECPLCRKVSADDALFGRHVTECLSLKHLSCKYCDMPFADKMALHRHTLTCGVRVMCAQANPQDPMAAAQQMKCTEQVLFTLLSETLDDPDIVLFSADKTEECMERLKLMFNRLIAACNEERDKMAARRKNEAKNDARDEDDESDDGYDGVNNDEYDEGGEGDEGGDGGEGDDGGGDGASSEGGASST